MRIGCLGAARIAPNALIYPAKVRGGAVLQAVAARDKGRAETFAREHGFARTADHYAALVAADDVDLVYNALPIHLHAEWTIKALESGKHVLCEKPFAMNAGEARALLDAAAASGRRVIEAFHYRYHPGFIQCLDWLAAGEIGPVRRLEAVFNIHIDDAGGTEIRHRPETGGGSFMDLGCYPLSWALMVMGAAPERVEAVAALTPRGVDETMRADLTFAGGASAHLSCSMAADARFAARLKIVGEHGDIDFINPLGPHLGSRLTLSADGKTETASIPRLATYAYQLDAVLSALETNGPTLPTEGDAILRQQQTLDSVYAAAGLGHLRQTGVGG